MRQGMSFFFPNMCGKLVQKQGAASTAGKAALPMESSPQKPKMALAWLFVTTFHTFKTFS